MCVQKKVGCAAISNIYISTDLRHNDTFISLLVTLNNWEGGGMNIGKCSVHNMNHSIIIAN